MIQYAGWAIWLLFLCAVAQTNAVYRNFLYRGASPCYNFDSLEHQNATACKDSVIPGAYVGGRLADRPKDGKQLYNSELAQRFIFQHQNPADCRKAKFFIMQFDHAGHGLGSSIHVMSYGLTKAMMMNRVFIHAIGGHVWTHGNPLCKQTGNPKDDRLLQRWDQCIFLPFSQCTLDEVLDSDLDLDKIPVADPTHPRGVPQDKWDEHRVLTAADHLYTVFPPLMAEFLRGGPIPLPGLEGNSQQYGSAACNTPTMGDIKWAIQWWRAQSTAYIVRFDPAFKFALEEQKKKIFPQLSIPPGTIGVHIRRGDKHKESSDVDDATYMKQVEAVYAAAGGKLQRTIFLSTEDSEAVKFFRGQAGWTVLMTNVSRYHDGTISPMQFATTHGLAEVLLNDIANLDLALQCDAWVGSLSSNWVRLIHEIRSVHRCKADNLFYDSRHGDLWGDNTFVSLPALSR